jgi:hypothetical protein
MRTDRETIDALLDDVIKDEDEATDLDEPSPFLMALVHVENHPNYGSYLELYREADDRARTAIDLWMFKLFGYSVLELCMMARRIALGVKPEVAEWTHEDDPAYAIALRILERRDRRASRRWLKQTQGSNGLADKEESEE